MQNHKNENLDMATLTTQKVLVFLFLFHNSVKTMLKPDFHMIIMSQSVPSVTIPPPVRTTQGEIFRNWSNPRVLIFWSNALPLGKFDWFDLRGSSKCSKLYYLPTLNNYLTLRFQKESKKLYTEQNRTFIDYNFYLSKQFITRPCSLARL